MSLYLKHLRGLAQYLFKLCCSVLEKVNWQFPDHPLLYAFIWISVCVLHRLVVVCSNARLRLFFKETPSSFTALEYFKKSLLINLLTYNREDGTPLTLTQFAQLAWHRIIDSSWYPLERTRLSSLVGSYIRSVRNTAFLPLTIQWILKMILKQPR